MTIIKEKRMENELQHFITSDSEGNPLEGQKRYMLHLPAMISSSDFWSIIVYDDSTHMVIQTDQSWPSIFSNKKNLVYNSDGSINAWFGPDAFIENESNWIKTIPGKKWYMILRLYYPLKTWFDKIWQPGEIKEMV